ncbi:hypothetical protein QVD17_08767 [Tagetes erecta]|uniref:Uncharacterized protein n=1 Tax=Tagetes erecta TaxID=13708 RepID=A0AAD8L0G3_TARER|nr:hypothetical protein QVD17_08767 [Tagetes erecta]
MGEDILLTAKSIARMLRMERDVGSPILLSLEDVHAGFLEMGYEGTDYLDQREIKKTFLSKEWRFIAHVIIVCLDHRKVGTDGLNFEWAPAMLNLCRGDKANIPQMIFEYMLENISAERKDRWLLYPRFIQIFIDELKPGLQKLGDPLVLTKMNVRIFADCSTPRHDVSGKITYLFRNMYTDDRWDYIEKLKISEEKRFDELRDKIKDDIKKRKKFLGKRTVPFEEQIDEIEAEIAKSKGKNKRKVADAADTDVSRRKGKEPEVSETVPKTFKPEKKGFAGLDEDVIRGVNTSLANELSMIKTKLINAKERERHKESEMDDLRRIVLDQQVLIKKLLTELNEVKKEVKIGNVETEDEINEMVNIGKYSTLKEMVQVAKSRKEFAGFSGAGASGMGKEAEITDDFCLNIDTDLIGEEVVVDKEKKAEMKIVDEEEEEVQLIDYDSEPEFYEVDEKEMVYVAQRSGAEGDVFELDKSDWFKKVDEPEYVTPLFQNLDNPTPKDTDNMIFSWKYNMELRNFMIKRRGGGITYIGNRKHFKTLPKWDLRRFAVLPLINADLSDRAKLLEEEIQAGLKDNFVGFGYNKLEMKRSKKNLEWVTGKGKIVLKMKPIKTVLRVRVPDPSPSRLLDFEKWLYDNQTGEAVIRVKDGSEWRLFDPMEVFGFSDEDLKILCENPIRVGAGADTRKEATLFERVANRALGNQSRIEGTYRKDSKTSRA